jgi:hypothetical protein
VAVRVEPTASADLDDIARLLSAAFGATADAPFINRDLLRWKYLDPAGDDIPRSYVLRQESDIIAHCALMPLNFAARQISGACFMDWVGDRRVPGAGVTLLKKVLAQFDVGFIAGGSEATRALAPRLGFKQRQDLNLFARVIRPLGQVMTRPRTTVWRDAARLVRNARWSRSALGQIDAEWRAVSVSRFESLPDSVSMQSLTPERQPSTLNYWLRCPAAPVSAFEIRCRDARVGYFLLCQVSGQSRIVDLRLSAESSSDREMAYRVAVRTASEDRAACEVITLGSTREASAALEGCGFRHRGFEPLFVYDRRGLLRDAPPIDWSMLNDDTAYMHDPQNPYAT